MTKKVQNPETDIMIESKGKIESFFDKYGSKIMWGLLAVAVIGIGVYFYIDNRNEADMAKDANSHKEFFTAFNEINEDANSPESLSIDYAAAAERYLAIANEYAETATGNMCYFFAASNYLYAGDLANAKVALAKLQKVEGDFGAHINAMALTLAGDIAVEEDDLQTAAAKFESALAASQNIDIYGDNARKLGLVYQKMGENAKAQAIYKAAIEKHSELTATFAKYIVE